MPLSYTTDLELLGVNHQEHGKYHAVTLTDTLAAGITAGNGGTALDKKDPNEDALGIVTYADGSKLYMIADAHFGASMGVTAIQRYPAILAEAMVYVGRRPEATEAVLNRTVLELGREAYQTNCGASSPHTSATTFLAVLEHRGHQGQSHYVSVADSFLYILNQEGAKHINHPNRFPGTMFIGQPNQPLRDEIIKTGSYEASPGSVILLASDGVDDFSISDVRWAFLVGGVRQGLNELLDVGARECKDNLAAIALQR